MAEKPIYRIAVTGTESTGKTELIQQLAVHYNTVYVPDYSRDYVEQINRPYTREDVIRIAEGIIEREEQLQPKANGILFSDNDLINIKIWLRYYNWEVPAWLNKSIIQHKNALYLLCDIDLPWVSDNQRANPHDRAILLAQFKSELSVIGANYGIVTGEGKHRFQSAVNQIDRFLKKSLF